MERLMNHLRPFDWRALGLSLLNLIISLAPSVHAQIIAPAPDAPTGHIAKFAKF
jgi:hypothetical protein